MSVLLFCKARSQSAQCGDVSYDPAAPLSKRNTSVCVWKTIQQLYKVATPSTDDSLLTVYFSLSVFGSYW